MKLPTAQFRQWLYTVAAAALAVLVYYGIVDAESVPLWLALIAALGAVGNGTAAVALHSQRKDGTVQ